ncbi:MAG: hypothetical protein JWO73_642 [Candidatus Taylorbacteria bacterium]|nr:hypothetical protein [Candidatus Taylorbacteria bacterium]
MEKKQDSISTGTMVAIGAGVAALGAASYYLFGPEGKRHQKNLKGWMIRAKGEIIEKLEAAKEVTEPVYNQIVDSVLATYRTEGKALSRITDEEMEALTRRLKGYWGQISGTTKRTAKTQAKKAGRKLKVKSASKKSR